MSVVCEISHEVSKYQFYNTMQAKFITPKKAYGDKVNITPIWETPSVPFLKFNIWSFLRRTKNSINQINV